MQDLTGRVALVAGGSGGMGNATACLLAECGAEVFVSARTMEKARNAADAAGTRARPVVLDTSDRLSWEAAIEQVRRQFGKLHILINASGICEGNNIENGTDDDLARHMAVNVNGIFIGCQVALPLLRQSDGKGSIVNIGSVIVARPDAELMAYGASKGAMAELSKSIALYCARQKLGIRVNVIHPGGVRTEMFEQALKQSGLPYEEAYRMWEGAHPIGRFGMPREVAEAVLWLASDASSFTTGAEICVDGGQSIG